MKFAALHCWVLLITSSAIAAPPVDPGAGWDVERNQDGRWNESDLGPFLASVINTPQGKTAKGLSIRVGDQQQAAVSYDTATGAIRCGWTGDFLRFNPRKFGVVETPAIAGELVFHHSGLGYEGKVKYLGLSRRKQKVVLRYQVDGATVKESPWCQSDDHNRITFTRTWEFAPHSLRLQTGVASGKLLSSEKSGSSLRIEQDGKNLALALTEKSPATLVFDQGQVLLRVPPHSQTQTIELQISSYKGDAVPSVVKSSPGLQSLADPAGPLWPEEIVTQGVIGKDAGPYTVDTLIPPFENPYKALLFFGGHDFLRDGRLAACTLHGDVWLIDGVDRDLKRIVWKRFASGLHQPLGLKIVDDQIYVLGRDQITRLRDLNQDGEADEYDNFNNEGQTSTGGHDYAAGLETDPDGNFYYIRAHEGVVRVAADGSHQRSIATGFRNPVGLGVSPTGIVTASPQEGNWTPATSIIEVHEDGYYGYAGAKVSEKRPLGYDPPLCWMPREQDNSAGGQVWVDNDQWGLPQGAMLHLSYGQCALMLVLTEHVDGVAQGGTVRLPMFFESGVMRGRFSPHDHQLYLSGMRGWQTSAAKDGCLQRVRYTGKPVHLPTELHVTAEGLELVFNEPLDADAAGDPENYFIEAWNYKYSKDYGSKEYLPSDPRKFGREELFIDDVVVSADARRVRLILEEPPQPVMQMAITYSLKTPDDKELRNTIFSTINRVPPNQE